MNQKPEIEKIRVLVADDNPRQLPYIIASLIPCNDARISRESRIEIVRKCFDLEFTNSAAEVEKLVTRKKDPFIPHIALLDVNFEKNASSLSVKIADLRYKGIELADLIKQHSKGFTKVILNTGFSEHKEWKQEFERRGYKIKTDYSRDDSDNTIYRKEKRGDKGTDAVIHLFQPILNHFAINTYRQLTATSKRDITRLLDAYQNRNMPSDKLDAALSKLQVVTEKKGYLLGSLFYFNADIIIIDAKPCISHSGLGDVLSELIAETKATDPGLFPFLNGPWKIKEIQEEFVEYFSEEKAEKIAKLIEKVKMLTLGFFTPLLLGTGKKFDKHGYSRRYTLDTFQKNPSMIKKKKTRFLEAMVNNLVVRISAVLAANVCGNLRLSYTVPGNIPAFRLHKKAFKIYIDMNPAKISFDVEDYEYEHKHVSSFITTRLGLTYNEAEDIYLKSDLCEIEQEVYETCILPVLAICPQNR